MKTFIAILTLAFASVTAYAAAEEKKVCKIDEKTKKEVCKTIKVHKKVEGDKVPEPKK